MKEEKWLFCMMLFKLLLLSLFVTVVVESERQLLHHNRRQFFSSSAPSLLSSTPSLPSGGYRVVSYNVYFNGRIVEGLDSWSFKDLGYGYAKDSVNVFFTGKKIPRCIELVFSSLERWVVFQRFYGCLLSGCEDIRCIWKLLSSLGWPICKRFCWRFLCGKKSTRCIRLIIQDIRRRVCKRFYGHFLRWKEGSGRISLIISTVRQWLCKGFVGHLLQGRKNTQRLNRGFVAWEAHADLNTLFQKNNFSLVFFCTKILLKIKKHFSKISRRFSSHDKTEIVISDHLTSSLMTRFWYDSIGHLLSPTSHADNIIS